MARNPIWTEDLVATLSGQITDFERASFGPMPAGFKSRRVAMRYAARSCISPDVSYILSRSIDDLAEHPEHVRRAINLARDHVRNL